MASVFKELGRLVWNGRVTRDTLYCRQADYGIVSSEMILYRENRSLFIEWNVYPKGDYDAKKMIDQAEINIETVGRDVVDYDGVFELPLQAIKLLHKAGLRTKEVEVK